MSCTCGASSWASAGEEEGREDKGRGGEERGGKGRGGEGGGKGTEGEKEDEGRKREVYQSGSGMRPIGMHIPVTEAATHLVAVCLCPPSVPG